MQDGIEFPPTTKGFRLTLKKKEKRKKKEIHSTKQLLIHNHLSGAMCLLGARLTVNLLHRLCYRLAIAVLGNSSSPDVDAGEDEASFTVL